MKYKSVTKYIIFFSIYFSSIGLGPFYGTTALANEGMWLPILLEQLNETEMQEMGLKLRAEDIYSVNDGSLKDAVVRFGNSCTGSIISEHGLLLTNYHCTSAREMLKTAGIAEPDLKDAFWAKSRAKKCQ